MSGRESVVVFEYVIDTRGGGGGRVQAFVRSLPEETLRQSPQLSEAHYEAAWRTGQWDVGDDSSIVEGSGGSGHFHQVIPVLLGRVRRSTALAGARENPDLKPKSVSQTPHKTVQENNLTTLSLALTTFAGSCSCSAFNRALELTNRLFGTCACVPVHLPSNSNRNPNPHPDAGALQRPQAASQRRQRVVPAQDGHGRAQLRRAPSSGQHHVGEPAGVGVNHTPGSLQREYTAGGAHGCPTRGAPSAAAPLTTELYAFDISPPKFNSETRGGDSWGEMPGNDNGAE